MGSIEAGDPAVAILRALGFKDMASFVNPPQVKFARRDCNVFERYPHSVHWDDENVPPIDQSAFKSIRVRLKNLATWLAHTGPVNVPMRDYTSLPTPNGRTPPNIWSCIFPAGVVNKSYALQVALIISDRGAEICICLGAGRSAVRAETLIKADQSLRDLKAKLVSTPPNVIATLEELLPENVVYRDSWLKTPGASDFDSLKAWLTYAGGPRGAQASISMYLNPNELESLGTQVGNVFREMSRYATILFDYCYPERKYQMPDSPDDRAEIAKEEVLREWPNDLGTVETVVSISELPRAVFDVQSLKQLAEAAPHELKLDTQVYRAVVSALRSGKHIILTGPPGTAKTTLAELVGQLAQQSGRCSGYALTTATADWTTYETIGGLRPAATGGVLEFQEGIILEAIQDNRWLIIDELNRSNFDRAFGQLFTVLSGQPVVLPYEPRGSDNRILLFPEKAAGRCDITGYSPIQVPDTWRIVATMNVFDKSLLFEMSFALMRRFAFIEVPSPSPEVFAELWNRELKSLPEEQAEIVGKVLNDLLGLREVKEIGPAIFIDMARFADEYQSLGTPTSAGRLAFQLFYSYLLPQYEGITQPQGQELFKRVAKIIGSQYRERLANILTEVLGISFPRKVSELEDYELDPLRDTPEATVVPGDE